MYDDHDYMSGPRSGVPLCTAEHPAPPGDTTHSHIDLQMVAREQRGDTLILTLRCPHCGWGYEMAVPWDRDKGDWKL